MVSELDAEEVIPEHPALDPDDDEPEVHWDYYGGFLDEHTVIAGTTEATRSTGRDGTGGRRAGHAAARRGHLPLPDIRRAEAPWATAAGTRSPRTRRNSRCGAWPTSRGGQDPGPERIRTTP